MVHRQLDDALQRRRHQMLTEQLTGYLAEHLGRRQLVLAACAHMATLRPIEHHRSPSNRPNGALTERPALYANALGPVLDAPAAHGPPSAAESDSIAVRTGSG